jgi:UDP-N-acetylmuramyl pentapeptide phosphotransferase/UDP-N-acetylglucosamine-1-phosphate transferase
MRIEIFTSVFLAFLFSLTITLIIVSTFKWHYVYTSEYIGGVQKIHDRRTPRIGGLGIYLAIIITFNIELNEKNSILNTIIYSGSIPFLFGFVEDVTKQVGVIARLFATMIAGIVGWAVTGITLTHIGVEIIDNYLLKNQITAILITAIAVGGISNSVNLIDGLNGLASSVLIILHLAIGIIAYSSGDTQLFIACITLAAAICGFFVINWPWGKIFLGDGGSYYCGFSLAWCCIMLVERNITISPFAALLICIYPFTETIFSIYRRLIRRRQITGPDTHHLHSLIYRRYIKKNINVINRNSKAGIFVAMLSLPTAILACIAYKSNMLCMLICILYMILYIVVYKRIINFKW